MNLKLWFDSYLAIAFVFLRQYEYQTRLNEFQQLIENQETIQIESNTYSLSLK